MRGREPEAFLPGHGVTPAVEARRLLRARRSGALATVSKRLNGYPYASVVPFMTDHDGSPVLLLSRLAEHTKNVAADERVSLMVHEPQADVQAAARLTLAGTCRRIERMESMRQRYLGLFPHAAELLALDFDFYRIVPVAIRYIGGFGAIHWIACAAFMATGGITAAVEAAWLPRLNAEHGAALIECVRRRAGSAPREPVRAVALDCDGFDLRWADRELRVSFPDALASADDLPAALASLAEADRA
jgi:putative heme iron utilization protein